MPHALWRSGVDATHRFAMTRRSRRVALLPKPLGGLKGVVLAASGRNSAS